MSLGSRLYNFFSSTPKDPEIRADQPAAGDASILTPIRYSVKSRRGAWVAGSLAAFVAVASIFTGVYFQLQASEPGEYRSVFVRDQPVGLDALYVSLDRVVVGVERHALQIHAQTFDLLKHRSNADALEVASGFVPQGTQGSVRMVFSKVIACQDLQCREVHLESTVLKVRASNARNVLVDINAEQSLKTTSTGQLAFEAKVTHVYMKEPEQAYADWKETTFEAQVAKDLDAADQLATSADPLPTDLPTDVPTDLPSPTVTEPCLLDCATLPTRVPTLTTTSTTTSSSSSTTPPTTSPTKDGTTETKGPGKSPRRSGAVAVKRTTRRKRLVPKPFGAPWSAWVSFSGEEPRGKRPLAG